MNIESEFQIDAAQTEVWHLLADPAVIQAAMPSVEEMVEGSPDHYSIVMKVGIGMVRGTFTGTITVADKEFPILHHLVVEAKGAGGWVKGDGTINLSELESGETLIKVDGTTQVGGVLARVGQRFMHHAARSMLNQFFNNLEGIIATRKEQSG